MIVCSLDFVNSAPALVILFEIFLESNLNETYPVLLEHFDMSLYAKPTTFLLTTAGAFQGEIVVWCRTSICLQSSQNQAIQTFFPQPWIDGRYDEA